MANKIKIPVAIVVILSIISFSLPSSQVANAQGISETLIGGLSCTTGRVLANVLVNKIVSGIKHVASEFMKQAGTRFRFGSWLYDQVVPIGDNPNDTREGFLDIAARCFARQILNDITARMIGTARTSGRDARDCSDRTPAWQRGACPSFVRDWRRFLTNAQHRGENIFRSMIGSASLCNNILNLKNVFNATNEPDLRSTSVRGQSYSINNLRVGNLNTFYERSRCTMPQGWTLQKYTNDFAGNGSWSALTRLAEPQNNYYGALIMSLGELAAQRVHEEKSDSQEAGPTGFTARRGKPGNTCLIKSNIGQCVIYKDILTPGSVISNAVYATIQEELAWITNVDEWQELISRMMARVMTRILNLSEPSNYDQEDFARENTKYDSFYDGDDFDSIDFGPSTPPMPPVGSVTVCADANYQGFCETFSFSDPDLRNNPILNDSVSSILVPANTVVALYEHINYGGVVVYTGSDDDLSSIPSIPGFGSFDNETSSIKISLSTSATCQDRGQSDNYSTQVQTAINTVVNTTTLDDGQTGPGNEDDMGTFLDAVVLELRGAGLRAGRVNNGRLSIDSIIVGQSSDSDGTVYIIIADAFSSSTRIGDKTQVLCSDHGSWSWLQDPGGIPVGSIPYGINLQTSGGQVVSSIDDGNTSSYGYLAVVGYPYGSNDFVLLDLNGGILESGDKVAIKNQAAYYFSARNGGGSRLSADAGSVGQSEELAIIKSDGSAGQITSGITVNFAGSACCYMVAENGGGDLVNFDRPLAGAWEAFILTITGNSPPPLPQPGNLPPPPTPQTAQCDDGADNDSDGQIDYVSPYINTPPDSDCSSVSDNDESQ
ncbi:MAG: hypothetical protein A3B91_03860 [Candidatus Yanofskybacteria bacterium RIFCSPHIGHO2_02_FULL_41_29]|nr:MAG: hypothetical protein A3B91_03860 [Candidatus Yanofskybacteria bacterium RIFCSPHIGHO2_02_FULL_41_29]OGN21761.1 MAG: hypothetical protein A2916_03350 [Candidatus Yanofskybacteria bacterium RIFCSPLOWO2_01_FULL_41_67]OGN29557.1 MAG: hypothetical protein A3H54_01500 [Candidatus Yanofskybacteria bacterium RIFCSPLOWO2_02_FULL_41_13]